MIKARPRLLGIAASLRNARWGAGNRHLVEEISAIGSREELDRFLTRESELHLGNFLEAGRRDGKGFEEIYRNLRKSNGQVGLSNSEIALTAALWDASRSGVDVDHLSLAEFFTAGGDLRNGAALRNALLASDGILISGPVYFGDRGSLAESLIEFIRSDAELREAMKGKLYGGIAVGAKRNGGQETTLIYQMMDMAELDLLVVGNDSDTTAQYGGTVLAGDVGTAHKDKYGLDTSVGVGRRMANVLKIMNSPERLADVPRVLFLILQDQDGGVALAETRELVSRLGPRIAPTVIDLSGKSVKRCIACDICPTHIDIDDSYRCIIKSGNDDLSDVHADLLHHDMLVPVVASASNAAAIATNYQTFIERSRYLRRGDYVWSDLLVAPLSFVDSYSHNSFLLRMMTSFIRHHTIMAKPAVGFVADGKAVNRDQIAASMLQAVRQADRLTAGRLTQARRHASQYNPVGYVLSADKDAEDQKLQRRAAMVEDRKARLEREARARLLRDVANG